MNLELRRETWKALNRETLGRLPAIESDNGIALDELVKWCGARHYVWTLKSYADMDQYKYSADLYGRPFNYIREHAATISEAICRAIIAASKEKV